MRQDIMVRSMTLRCHEKVMIYNRFAALDEPECELPSVHEIEEGMDDLFFDWDELEKTWAEIYEPMSLHDFAFVSRYCWADGPFEWYHEQNNKSKHPHKTKRCLRSMKSMRKKRRMQGRPQARQHGQEQSLSTAGQVV